MKDGDDPPNPEARPAQLKSHLRPQILHDIQNRFPVRCQVVSEEVGLVNPEEGGARRDVKVELLNMELLFQMQEDGEHEIKEISPVPYRHESLNIPIVGDHRRQRKDKGFLLPHFFQEEIIGMDRIFLLLASDQPLLRGQQDKGEGCDPREGEKEKGDEQLPLEADAPESIQGGLYRDHSSGRVTRHGFGFLERSSRGQRRR
jgi:hypothetical protein